MSAPVSTSRPRPCNAGFTLVELLASLVVLAMVCLMLVAGLGGRATAWSRMDRDTTRSEGVEAAQALLRDRLQRVWPTTVYNIQPPGPDFDGQARQAVFLAPPPQAAGPAALRRYQLGLDAGGDLLLLSRSDVAADRRRWSQRQVVLRGVESLDLAYFGAATRDVAPGWRPDWSEQPVMPALVRVRVGFAPGDPRVWPELIVRPAADIDTNCILVASTGGCRGR